MAVRVKLLVYKNLLRLVDHREINRVEVFESTRFNTELREVLSNEKNLSDTRQVHLIL